MASIIHTAAQRINADTAGVTYLPQQAPGMPAAPTITEVTGALLHGTSEGLGFLTGGIHPENLPLQSFHPLQTAEVVPTDSRPGLLGGLIPRPQGTVAPGPAGGASQLSATVAKLRARLKI